MQQRYIIGAVYEKDAKTPKESAQHIIGRTGKLDLDYLELDTPMWFEYDCEELKGKAMRTSWVKWIDKGEGSIWVHTENSVYRFNEI